MSTTTFVKGVAPSQKKYDGSSLRILLLHTRWNVEIVGALVEGARKTLLTEYDVRPENIITEEVSGSYELPFAAQRLIAASRAQSTQQTADDLFSGESAPDEAAHVHTQPFDAVICIGVLIKGATSHFEYIADAVSHGIMRVGLDTGVPCVFGVLTCLNDDQALERAGLGEKESRHNHGIDWAHCAVELGVKNRAWSNGRIQ